jgi:hypothetical protein
MAKTWELCPPAPPSASGHGQIRESVEILWRFGGAGDLQSEKTFPRSFELSQFCRILRTQSKRRHIGSGTKIVVESMEETFEKIIPAVPFVVEPGIADSWES